MVLCLTGTGRPASIQQLAELLAEDEHDHILGSCKGELRFNAYVLSFVPLGNSTDDFLEPFSQVRLFAPGDKLKIEIRVKTYHFAADVDSKLESKERIRRILQDLRRRMAAGQERGLEARKAVN